MFAWYGNARVCLAYLADVRPSSAGEDAVLGDFGHSEWFRRGWTLQELLAPSSVVFLNQEWEIIGDKRSCVSSWLTNRWLNSVIASITGIPEKVLLFPEDYEIVSIEERMKWAESRKMTTYI